MCTHASLPSLLRCELRNKFSASLCFRDVHREMDLSLSRSSESIEHHTNLCLICDFCLKVACMFRKYNIQCLSSSTLNGHKCLAHLEVLRVSHAADHVLRLLAKWVER